MEQVARATNLRAASQKPKIGCLILRATYVSFVLSALQVRYVVVHFTHSARTCLGIIHWNASGK